MNYTTGIVGPPKEIYKCLTLPPKVSSPGLAALVMNKNTDSEFMDFAAPRLHLQIVVTYVVTQTIHNILKFLGLPIFISQFLAGIILGPIVFKKEHSFFSDSEDSIAIMGTMASLGYVFFLFLSGVKMDLAVAYKSGKKALCIGVLTVLLPLISCLVIMSHDSPPQTWENNIFTNKTFFLAVTYSRTSFPVIHYLLSELKISNSELGRLGLSASLVSDILSLVLINIGQWVKIACEAKTTEVLKNCGLPILFVLVVAYALRPTVKWMVKCTQEEGKIKDAFFYFVILAFLMTPWIVEYFNVFLLFGPFILGLAIPDGPPLGSALVEKLDPVVSGLFLPLFATTCGMRIDPSKLLNIKYDNFARHQAIAIVHALIIKFVVSLVIPLLCNMPTRDSFTLAFILMAKGIVEMGSYSYMFDSGVISNDILIMMSVLIILVSCIVPLVVKMLYDPSRKYVGYMKRSIMHSKVNEELRVISCIHVPSNVSSIINILNASCLTKQNPIALDVLHLIKLRGQATPLFITNQKHTTAKSNKSYSENVISSFNQFERDNWEAATVNVFTAVSPTNLMYEDICNLALDKLTSFIVLPFHRRWYIDGNIESEDQTIRSLNCNVLKRAPCSVGILVEGRRHLKRLNSNVLLNSVSSYNVGVIFIGGKDDREALALAKRISYDQSVSLTVVHIMAAKNLNAISEENSDKQLDEAMLKNIRESTEMTYVEGIVNNGPETSTFLKSIVNDYQLIIVGGRYNYDKEPQTDGLHEWTEFPEIGIIGDLLSSSDFIRIGNYSLMIVQQQRTS